MKWTLRSWIKAQEKEALSAENRYHYWKNTGKDGDKATLEELMIHYTTRGGARDFAKKHQKEREEE